MFKLKLRSIQKVGVREHGHMTIDHGCFDAASMRTRASSEHTAPNQMDRGNLVVNTICS